MVEDNEYIYEIEPKNTLSMAKYKFFKSMFYILN